MRNEFPAVSAAGVVVVGLILLGLFAIGAVHTVDSGEVCVATRFGEAIGERSEGLHVELPFAVNYHCYSRRTVSYETSAHPASSQADYTDQQVAGQTSDGQSVKLSYTVLYRVDSSGVARLYTETAENMDRLNERAVKAKSRSLVRNAVPGYTAEALYSGEGRRELQLEVSQELERELASQGVVLEAFLLRDADFDETYVQAIEDQQIAQERVETRQYEAEAAEFEAARAIELARGEAEAIRVRGEALREYPEILQLQFIEQLEGVQWSIMPFDSIQPFLPLDDISISPNGDNVPAFGAAQ